MSWAEFRAFEHDEANPLPWLVVCRHEPALRVPANRITAIIASERAVTADTALRLARYFGTTPEFWINLQSGFDLTSARALLGKRIESEVSKRVA